jgi:dipeptidase D
MGFQAAFHDYSGNVIARRPAFPGRESAPAVLLQSHLDQVDTRIEDESLLKQPIYNEISDGRLIGVNSSNGADGQCGVATILALAEYSDRFQHGPLEIFFTNDEETTFKGVYGIFGSEFLAKYYLNLDASDISDVSIGCAGVKDLFYNMNLTSDSVSQS